MGTSANKVAEAKRIAEVNRQAARRKSIAVWSVAAVAGVAVFAALVAFIVNDQDHKRVNGAGQLTPTVVSDDDGIGVGASGVAGQDLGKGTVRLDLYIDPMCPVCGGFEQYEADVLDALREDGTIDVYYHPLNGLDDKSQGTRYSSRASAALVLVAQDDPAHFLAYVKAIYENQPEEYTPGLDDAKLAAIAVGVGVPEAVAAKIPSHPYMDWVSDASMRANEAGVSVFPTLAVDGVIQDPLTDPNAINWGASETALHDALVKLAEAKH